MCMCPLTASQSWPLACSPSSFPTWSWSSASHVGPAPQRSVLSCRAILSPLGNETPVAGNKHTGKKQVARPFWGRNKLIGQWAVIANSERRGAMASLHWEFGPIGAAGDLQSFLQLVRLKFREMGSPQGHDLGPEAELEPKSPDV